MSRTTHQRRALPALLLTAAVAAAGAGTNPAWQAFLPAEASQELQARSVRAAAGATGKRKLVEEYFQKGYVLAAGKGGAELRLPERDDLGEMMNLLRTKAKGGEGTAPELQYNGKLKKQDGIEPLIGALASKQLTADNVGKTSKELELLAYRVAVLGAITHDNPAGKEKLDDWRKLSLEMRDSAIALARAAQAKDAAGIQKASTRLEGTCTGCHREFRK